MENMKIETKNSGRVKLLRNIVRFATKNSPQELGLVHFAKQFVKVQKLLIKPTKTGKATGDLYEELCSRLKFLEIPREQYMGAIDLLANGETAVPLKKVLIDGEAATDTCKKIGLRGANSRAVHDEGINPSIAHLVVDASLGRNSVPYAYQSVTVKGVERLLEPAKANETIAHIPAPVIATMGRCECCVAGTYRHLLDALIKASDLPVGSISKLVKKVPNAGVGEMKAQELLDEMSGDATLTPAAVMAYMMNFDGSAFSDSLIIPVLTFKTFRQVHGKRKNKSTIKTNWTISWHCVECLRDYYFPRTDGDVRARVHTHYRLTDVRNLITKDITKSINTVWKEKYLAERDAKAKGVIDKQSENISEGRTRSGGTQHDPAVVADVLDRFVSCYGDKSKEVKDHLFYNKRKGKSFSTKWGIKRDSSFHQVYKILQKGEKEMKNSQDEQLAIMDLVQGLTAGLPENLEKLISEGEE